MALSLDLRGRIIKAYENGEGSVRKLAKRFAIGSASVWRLLKRYHDTGELKHKSPPGRTSRLGEKELKLIYKLLQKDNDATLKELCHTFTQKTGIEVSIVTMHRLCHRLKLRYKKNLISS